MRKFFFRDEDGDLYEAQEVQPVEKLDEEPIEEPMKDEALTEEEISALKQLAAVAPKLIAMCDAPAEPVEEPIEEPIEEPVEEPVEELDSDEQIEEVIDTEEQTMKKDSKKSFGSIEKKVAATDSVEQDIVSAAWQKRYGG